MIKINKFIHLILSLTCLSSYGQISEFNYYRPITGIEDQWHSIKLHPNDYQYLNSQLSDIRIYGITEKNDTIEAPYLLEVKDDKITSQKVAFKLVNESRNASGFYYTFEVPDVTSINKIDLNWSQQNFDWFVTLEGSHDQKEWFTILEDYRILSINNNATNYNFNHLNFPSSNYRYYRLLVSSKKDPLFKSATINHIRTVEGEYHTCESFKTNSVDEKTSKNSIINVKFNEPVFLSQISIPITDDFDYYRSFSIKQITDSSKTEKGWKYNYKNVTTGILSSLEDNIFNFNGTVVEQLQIKIFNQDNQPLSIGDIQAKGYDHELHVRFTESANYVMSFGNKKMRSPVYDLAQFSNTIPKDLHSLRLGEKVHVAKKEVAKVEPLIENKSWLWLIMGAIILLLGWFTLSMIGKK